MNNCSNNGDNNDFKKSSIEDAKWYKKFTVFLKDKKFIFVFIVFLSILIYLTISGIFPNYTPEKTLNIISLIIQIEAAVIAIIITLSLVAVQLVAQSYSTRVIGIFTKSNSFRAIVILYISAIITGLSTLILADNGIELIIIQKLVLIDYYVSIVAFISLFPFILATFNLLKPSSIIKELSKDINKEKILSHLKNKKVNEDPVQPIVDIIHSSCIKNDYNTFEKGLNEIHNSISQIVNNDKLNQDEMINYLLNHYNTIGRVALTNNDEKYVAWVIMGLFAIGEHSTEEKLENEETNTMIILGDIGKISASKFVNVTVNAAEFLKNIHIMAMDKNKEISLRHVADLGYIGQIALEQKYDYVADQIISFIEKIINKSFEEDKENIIQFSLLSLRRIGKTALEKDLDLSIETIIEVINGMGKKSVKNYEMATEMALFVLEEICIITLNKRLESIVVSSIKSFEYIGEEAVREKKLKIIDKVLVSFYRIGNVSLEHNIESSINAILKSLKHIGNCIIHEQIDNLDLEVGIILEKLKKIAKKQKMEDVCQTIDNIMINLEDRKNEYDTEIEKL